MKSKITNRRQHVSETWGPRDLDRYLQGSTTKVKLLHLCLLQAYPDIPTCWSFEGRLVSRFGTYSKAVRSTIRVAIDTEKHIKALKQL